MRLEHGGGARKTKWRILSLRPDVALGSGVCWGRETFFDGMGAWLRLKGHRTAGLDPLPVRQNGVF